MPIIVIAVPLVLAAAFIALVAALYLIGFVIVALITVIDRLCKVFGFDLFKGLSPFGTLIRRVATWKLPWQRIWENTLFLAILTLGGYCCGLTWAGVILLDAVEIAAFALFYYTWVWLDRCAKEYDAAVKQGEVPPRHTTAILTILAAVAILLILWMYWS